MSVSWQGIRAGLGIGPRRPVSSPEERIHRAWKTVFGRCPTGHLPDCPWCDLAEEGK